MVDNFPKIKLGQDVLGNATKIPVKAAAAITRGQLCKITGTDANGIPIIDVAGAGDVGKVVAIETLALNEYGTGIVGGLTKGTAGGAIAIGASVKAGAAGKFVSAVRTVTIPGSGTAVTSSSAQPTMTVEGGIASGMCVGPNAGPAADGDTALFLMGVT